MHARPACACCMTPQAPTNASPQGTGDAGVARLPQLHHDRQGPDAAADAAGSAAPLTVGAALELPSRPTHHAAPTAPASGSLKTAAVVQSATGCPRATCCEGTSSSVEMVAVPPSPPFPRSMAQQVSTCATCYHDALLDCSMHAQLLAVRPCRRPVHSHH